ncbi:MAG: hypothetical protein GY723_14680, partial [bacterium]|nr:hypothetical protein [bacterium]
NNELGLHGAVVAGNVGSGIELIGAGIDDVLIDGNTASANGRAGLHLGPGSADAVVSDNRFGTDPSGAVARYPVTERLRS